MSIPGIPRSVLAVGAHPTDVEYYAGGMLGWLAEAGARVTHVVCTDGRHGINDGPNLVERRRLEAALAAEALGADRVVFLNYPDGALSEGEAMCRDLVQEIRRTRAELVLAHDPTMLWSREGKIVRLGDSDHRIAGQATLDAIQPRASSRSYYPEMAEQGYMPWLVAEVLLFDTPSPDHFFDLTPWREKKRSALAYHVSQLPLRLIEESEAEAEEHAARIGYPAESFRRLRLI